ncbi:galectin-12 isoform X2 [Alligator mississippiensis]|uniref:galectin-12 isoform X2 n=1 Tax=Alligator mississippiensis TaxID=8496 RepID=UPI002877FCE7|nr:galectin-12 isoform X2 [Alligator mississippiensis]
MGPPCSEAFVLQPPVWYPVLPYLTTIFGGLARRVVLLQGTVAAGAKRFHVSFQCGCSLRPRPDVAVGLCLRFGARARLVCAVREAGRWRGAVRLPRLALRPGDAVLLLFRFQQDHVQVSLNSQPLLCFRYRLPLARIDTLGVFGDAWIKAIAFLPTNPFDASQATCPTAQPLLPVQTQLAMPYSHPLPHGLTPGSTVIVWATVAEEPEHFSLSLRAAPPEPGLVLAACFRTGALTWCQGPGEAHEVLDGFPFHARRFFQLLLVVDAAGKFCLALNGVPLGPFHASGLAWPCLTQLGITGDLRLHRVLC